MRKVYGLLAIVIALTMTVGAFAPSMIDLHNRSAQAEIAVSDKTGVIKLMKEYTGGGGVWDFVSYDSQGRMVLTVDFDGVDLNPCSENYFDWAWVMWNYGAEDYNVTLTSSNPRIQFYINNNRASKSDTLNFLMKTQYNGKTMLGVYVDATGKYGTTISSTITVHATNP